MIIKTLKLGTALVLGAALSASVLAAGDGKKTNPGGEQPWSGFLGEDAVYEQMTKVVYKDKREGQRWLAPTLNFNNYQSILVEPVKMFPKPEPSDQVPVEVLKQIQTYLTDGLRERVGKVLNLVEAPAEGVVRMEVAITGVSVKTEGMKVYEVLPVAAIWGGLKAATGNRERNVRVFIETKVTDSVSGDLLGTAMRTLEGKDLKGAREKLQLEHVKQSLDQALDSTSDNVEAISQTGIPADAKAE